MRNIYLLSLLICVFTPIITFGQAQDIEELVPTACYNFINDFENDNGLTGVEALEPVGGVGQFIDAEEICLGGNNQHYQMTGDMGLDVDNGSLLSTSQYTIELLFKIDGIPPDNRNGRVFIMNFFNQNRAGLFINPAGYLCFYPNSGAPICGADLVSVDYPGELPSAWINIAVSFDGTDLVVYLNGEEQFRTSGNEFRLQNQTSYFDPSNSLNDNPVADITIDYLRYFDEVLDATSIESLNLSNIIGDDIEIQASATEGCMGQEITLSATGGARDLYIWSTGDTTTTQSINYTIFQEFDTVWVQGVAISPCERRCFDVADTIVISGFPLPELGIVGPNELCEDESVTFSSAADPAGIASYLWTTTGTTSATSGANSKDYSVTYNADGIYNISLALINEFGCAGDTTIQIIVKNVPTTTVTAPTSACEGEILNIVYTGDAGPGANFSWDFDGGVVVSENIPGRDFNVRWDSLGTKSVYFEIDEINCLVSGLITIEILKRPTLSLTTPQILCAGDIAEITYTGNADASAVFTWNFDGGVNAGDDVNALVEWTDPGTKNISLQIDQNGCVRDTTFSITVLPIPTTDITAISNICSGLPINIEYTGTANADAELVWNLDGGTVVSSALTDRNFDVQWATQGTKNITLTIAQDGCDTDTTFQVVVGKTPTSDFNMPMGACMDEPVRLLYVGTANLALNTPDLVFDWDFDGGVATDISSSQEAYDVEWSTPGTKTVTLQVTENGCTSTILSRNIQIFLKPIIDFDPVFPAVICLNDVVTVNFTGDAGVGGVFNWNFGDAAQLNVINANTQFDLRWSTTGLKTFSLEINNNGCITEEFFSVQVFTPPTTDLTYNAFACEGIFTRIIYTGTGNTDPASGTVYNWDFAGADEVVDLGNQAYDIRWNNFDEINAANNIKNISLEIIENGCTITRDFTIELTQTPVPTITAPSEVCVDQPVTIEFSSDLPAASFSFNVGTGVRSPTADPSVWTVTWATPGIKTISVTYSLNGCESTISQQINVLSVPSDAVDDQDEICDNEIAVFTYVGDGNPTTNITWTVPAGVTFSDLSGDSRSVGLTFPSTGATETYTIEALIENGICNITYSKNITVYPAAEATIPNPGAVCSTDPVTFNLSSYFVSGASYSWNWDGGVVTSNSGTGIWTVNWATAGTKNIGLTVRTPAGCIETDNVIFNVGVTPEMDLSVPSEVCDGDDFIITYNGDLTGVTNLIWTDQDGGNFLFDGTNSWTVNFANQGIKTLSFRAEGGAGCVVDSTFNIVVNSIPDFDLSSDNTCSGITVFVTFQGAFSPGVDTTWTFRDNITLEEGISRKLTDSTYAVEFATAGTKDIILTMTGGGCGDQTLTKQVVVIPGPEYIVDSNDEVCLDQPLGISVNQAAGTNVSITNVQLLPATDGATSLITPDGLFALISGWTEGGVKQAVLEITDNTGACTMQYDTINYIVYNYVEFELSSKNVCVGESVNLKLASLVANGSVFNWNFGDAIVTPIIENEEYELSWTNSGLKTVSLEIQSSCGLEMGQVQINVGDPTDLSLNFEPSACLGEAVPIIYDMGLLTTVSTLSSVEIKYLDLPFDSSNDDPTNGSFAPIWNTIGTKNFRLIVNNGGCIDSIDHQITIYEIPVASFNRSDNRVCVGEPVTFTFNGTAPQSTVFAWDFQEDDALDISENIVNTNYEVVWRTPGDKVVELILNNLGCTDTLRRTIRVDPYPDFSINLPAEICANAPFEVSLDNNGTGTIADFQFNWNFGDAAVVNLGNQTYELTYLTDGARTISVAISSIAGCNNSLSENIMVNPSPNILYDISSSVLCVGEVFNFEYTGVAGTDFTAPVVIQWDELDGGSETSLSNVVSNIVWTTPGIKNVSVLINDNLDCNAVLNLQVNVLAPPTQNMNYPTEACINEVFIVSYTGDANQTSDSFTWNFSDPANLTAVKIAGQQAYRLTYTTLGTKTINIEITNEAGCTTNFSINVDVNPGPDFDVNLSDVCTLNDLLFYVGTETVVNINPGQDGIWNPANPNVVLWTTAGLKTIALTLDNGSCVVTRNFQVRVYATPGGEIMITDACLGQPVRIEYGGVGAASIFANFDWGTSFDDAISVVKLAGREAYEVTWDLEGIYDITVEVTENGCTSTIALPTIDIRGVPVGNFSLPATICENEERTLTVENPYANYTYTWDLGADGIIVNANADNTQIRAVWQNRGDKTVSLITSLNDCDQVTEKAIRVLNAPDPSFNAPLFCFDEIINEATGTITYTGDNNLTTSTFIWDFNLDVAAGETATQIPGTQNYDLVYTTPGRKLVSLEVINANCGSRTFMDTIYVNNLAEFTFEAANDALCQGATAIFTFTGTAEENAVIEWDFDVSAIDVVTEIEEDYVYEVVYNSTGLKTISLNIRGVNCNDSYFEDTFLVGEAPVSDFTLSATDNCLGDLTTINFTGSATSGANWIWDFADGFTSPLGNQNYEVRWPTPGEKTISLVIEDGGCLSDTTYQTINIYDNTAVSLYVDSNLCVDSVGFASVNTEFLEPGATWSWRFNGADIISSNADSTEISFSYPTEGPRDVRFLVNRDICDNFDTTALVNIGAPLDFDIAADTKVCLGDSSRIVFNLPIVNGRTLTWNFDNPSTVNKISNNREDYYVIWNTVGIKNIQVSINNKGCIRDSSFQVEVTELPVANYMADNHYCAGDILSLIPEGNITPQTLVRWSYNYNGMVASSNNPNLQLLLTQPGTVELTLRILERGCQDFFTTTIEVRETPDAAINAPDVVCLEDLATVNFEGPLLPGLTYEWFFDDASTVNSLGSETYELGWEIGGNKTIWSIAYLNGCPSDTAFQTLNIFSVDNLEISSDTICQHQTLMVEFIEPSVETIGYTWNFDNAQIISGAGLGPYELYWDEPGEKAVTLNIDGVVCNSDQFTKTVLIEPTVFPSVILSIPNLVCVNTDISAVLSPSNEGDSPEYEWFINGRYVGTEFDSTLIQNNDTLQVRMTSNHPCAINNRIFSNEVVAHIINYQYGGNTNVMPVPLCIGDTASVYLDQGDYIITDWEVSDNLTDWVSLNNSSEVLRVAPELNRYYRAVITDLLQVCTQTTPAAEVEVVPYNPIEAGPDVTVRQGDFRILEATKGTNFVWRDHSSIEGDTRNSRIRVRPMVTTTFMVDGLTRDGCPDTDSVTVIVLPPVDFPNVITPNGDGINDFWMIDKIEEYPNSEVNIFNRWGKKLFTSTGYQNPWAGKFNGELLPPGVYYFVLDLKDGYEPYTGSISILY